MNQRKFSKEFKMEILREIDSGKTMGQVCREHQLNKSMV
jgi:transposase-like protein